MNAFFSLPVNGSVSPSKLVKHAPRRKTKRSKHGAGIKNRSGLNCRVNQSFQSDSHRKSKRKSKPESKENRVQQWLDAQVKQQRNHRDVKRKASVTDVTAAETLEGAHKKTPNEPPKKPKEPKEKMAKKKMKLSFLQLMGTAKKRAKQRATLYGSTKIKRQLLQDLVPPARDKQGFRVIITGPSGSGKSFIMNEIKQSFTNVLTMADIMLLKKSKLDVPVGRRVLVFIDDIEGMAPEAMNYVKEQMDAGNISINKRPPNGKPNKRKKRRMNVVPEQKNKIVNSTSYLFSCKDVYQLTKQMRWVRGLYTAKLYSPWESELMTYAYNEIRIKMKTADGKTLTRRPFQREIRQAAQACKRNFRQLEFLLMNPGASATDERMNVFQEVQTAMTPAGRFGSHRLTDTAKEMLVHNIYDNLNDENQLGDLCGALDAISIGDSVGTAIGEFVSNNCFAGTVVSGRPKTEFPTDTFRVQSCIRERRALQHQMSQFWSVAGRTGGRQTLSVDEIKFRHVHQLPKTDNSCVQDALLQSRAGPSLIPQIDNWMYKTL